MYEMTDKAIRAKFKKTELGIRYNRYLMVSVISTFIFLIVYVVMEFAFGSKDFNKLDSTDWLLISISSLCFFISCIVTCYFDGKRDGAIEQFKRTLKKK